MKRLVVMSCAAAAVLWLTGCQMLPWNPSAESILQKMDKTADPGHKLPGIKSSVFTYDMIADGKNRSECTVSLKSPYMFRFENKTPTDIHIIGYNGKSGWEFDSGCGLRSIAGQELNELRFQSVYLSPNSTPKDIFARTTLDGSEMVDGESCWKLTGYPLAEFNVKPISIFIGKNSNLLRKTVETQSAGSSASIVTTYFRDYKLSDGMLMPFTVVTVTSEQTINCKLKTVQWNPALPDSLFVPPLPELKK
jgi:outer membrane lipoprotein-sorting protein